MKTDKIKLMEVCGTHTMAIARSGIKKLLPSEIELISGPGCPVCVTAQTDIDRAIEIAGIEGIIMTTFGDMLRVPGTRKSLEEVKRDGADVRVLYSCLDALEIARDNPDKEIVFMGIGFETTSPTIASTILMAEKEDINNFSVLSNFKVLFPALAILASSTRTQVDGFICPGHVSVITGSLPYERIAKRYKKPCVITGFGDNDILKGIQRLVEKIKASSYNVEIEYKRVVKREGNIEARQVLSSVFNTRDSEWRGIGIIKKSGLKIRSRYREFDAESKFKVNLAKPRQIKGCICGEVLQGIRSPKDCRLFKKGCTPRKPIGPCMVSSEGTCAAYYKYGG